MHPAEEESEPEAEEEEAIVKAEYEPVDEADIQEVVVKSEYEPADEADIPEAIGDNNDPAAPASEAKQASKEELAMMKQKLMQAAGHGNGEPGGDIPEGVGDGAAPTPEIDNHDQGGTTPGEPDNVSEKDAIGDQGSTNMDEAVAEEPDSVIEEEAEVAAACDMQD
jgi:hypothetical protein